jgi:hypothetical protein
VRWATGVLAGLSLLLASCLGLPPRVDRITIANPTDYDLDVEVTGRDRDGWLPVVIMDARSEASPRR